MDLFCGSALPISRLSKHRCLVCYIVNIIVARNLSYNFSNSAWSFCSSVKKHVHRWPCARLLCLKYNIGRKTQISAKQTTDTKVRPKFKLTVVISTYFQCFIPSHENSESSTGSVLENFHLARSPFFPLLFLATRVITIEPCSPWRKENAHNTQLHNSHS